MLGLGIFSQRGYKAFFKSWVMHCVSERTYVGMQIEWSSFFQIRVADFTARYDW